MPFGDYKSLGEALKALQVTEARESFVHPRQFPVPDYFRSWLDRTLADTPVSCSEWAVCENLIHPVIREVHAAFAKDLVIWSHVSFFEGEAFLGVPDYIIARRSALSVKVMEPPLGMFVEAKRNDFDAGWAQCLAAMDAAQRVNGRPERVIHGVVSDGFVWQFGKLQGRTLVQNPTEYTLSRLDELFAALNHVFELCREQVLLPAEAA